MTAMKPEQFTNAHRYALELVDRYPQAAAVGFASRTRPDGTIHSRIVATIIRDPDNQPVTGDRMLADATDHAQLSRWFAIAGIRACRSAHQHLQHDGP